jgi:hypothetical protein
MYFEEKQRLRQWWIFIGLVPVAVILLVEFNRTEWNWMDMGFGVVPILLTLVLLFSIQLKTYITQEGVALTLFPFILRKRMFRWEDIDKAYVRTYQPLKEYGGWGLKGTSKNRAYNMSGKEGLQLELKDGRRVLIGTRKPADIEVALKLINKYNP